MITLLWARLVVWLNTPPPFDRYTVINRLILVGFIGFFIYQAALKGVPHPHHFIITVTPVR